MFFDYFALLIDAFMQPAPALEVVFSSLATEIPICPELDYGSSTKTTNFPFAWLDSIY
jgi:hypothetical protein